MASSGDGGGANASAERSQNDGYDPLKDPKRRPKSKDPGWKYAYYVEPGKRDLIQCALCPRTITGGIIRVKQHLAGGSTEIVVCPKTTAAIKKEMKAALDAGKKERPVYTDEDAENDAEGDAEEDTADIEVIESSRAGSSSTTGKRKDSGSKPPTPSSKKKPITSLLRHTPQEVVAERHAKGPYQKTINAAMTLIWMTMKQQIMVAMVMRQSMIMLVLMN